MRSLKIISPVPSDLTIAQSVDPLGIMEIAKKCGILESELKPYGFGKAKVCQSISKRLVGGPETFGKYIVVAGMSPTPLGEGKSTTTIGLAQAIGAHLNKQCMACIRQPSQGPTFGVKGGAAGGGYSQVIPMEEFNLHGTGDIHAITAANNLLAAAIDTRVYHERSQCDENLYRRLTDSHKSFTPAMITRLKKLGINKTVPEDLTSEERVKFSRLNIDPETISWKRVTDCNDRMMRNITIGQGPNEKGWTRQTGFDISVASEVMAILALASDLHDMRTRFGDIVVARNTSGEVVTAEDLGVAGAMAVLMREAIEPTLMQTLERTPVLVHAGPFGNIAHGNSSIVADQIALRLVGKEGFVLTEAGFGADMGCEKFFNIKCRTSGLKPDAAVLVATIRALKFHAGIAPENSAAENIPALEEGSSNLVRHIQNMGKFQVPTVVVLNKFTTDTDAEIAAIKKIALEAGAFDVVTSEHWTYGGAGAVDAAKAVARCAASGKADFKLLYPNSGSLKSKIEAVAKEIYGADGVEYLNDTEAKIKDFEAKGFGEFPVCMAKTQYSFSHDPKLKGAPTGFTVPVRDIRASTGARFVFPLLGEISTMPGLPTRPAYYNIDIDSETGEVIGLS